MIKIVTITDVKKMTKISDVITIKIRNEITHKIKEKKIIRNNRQINDKKITKITEKNMRREPKQKHK